MMMKEISGFLLLNCSSSEQKLERSKQIEIGAWSRKAGI